MKWAANGGEWDAVGRWLVGDSESRKVLDRWREDLCGLSRRWVKRGGPLFLIYTRTRCPSLAYTALRAAGDEEGDLAVPRTPRVSRQGGRR